ncbi:MAG: hypothetical protein ACFFAU_14900 [Candidatus Hodarchaeota archaeon]
MKKLESCKKRIIHLVISNELNNVTGELFEDYKVELLKLIYDFIAPIRFMKYNFRIAFTVSEM